MGLCALCHGIQILMEAIWLATQRDPQNDWTATQNRVNYDVMAQAPCICRYRSTELFDTERNNINTKNYWK